jgi:dipeptidyl aminopeptidase/acylaminoacyl peptidase
LSKTVSPYGAWPSPLGAAQVVAGAVSISEVVPGDDDLWWAEGRPEEGGRVVVVRHTPGGVPIDVLPEGWSARTRVHEYGGGAWWTHDDTLYFANWEDQRLYRVDPDGAPGTFLSPVALTPEPAVAQGDRYADGVISVDGRWVICIRERHRGDGAVDNEIVAIDASGGGEPVVLVTGPDFVASPRVSPDGARLCCLQWNHPDMPWDATELVVAPFLLTAPGEIALGPASVVAGGPGEWISQPEWDATGALWFLSDRSDWSNLYRIGADAIAATTPGAAPPPASAEVVVAGDIAVPAWVFAQSRYALLSDAPGGAPARVAFAYTAGGIDHLAVARIAESAVADLNTGFVTVGSVRRFGGGIAFVAASPTSEPVVAIADLPVSGDATVAIVRPPRDLGIDSAWWARPEPVSFATADGAQAHALLYRPHHLGHEGPADAAPPLIVMSHGGPTAAARPHLSLTVQFWTTRGFAVVDVNYRGSSGYGRAYRQALTGQWGIADVEDCAAAARALVADGLVDEERLAIRGGSAGGFTTLAALAFRDDFRAGTSLYGVADLEALARDTHKFEARYLDSLIGPYPEQRDLYLARSPIHHVDGFNCALLVLQGLEDAIVPPAQSEMIVEAVRAKGLPVAMIGFEGEQHGFRDAANIRRSLEAELYFYSRVFGIDVADRVEPVTIENL